MKRYMDDVITITAKDDSVWDVDRFREDFRRSECYWAPLKLEAAESAHFLETTLELDPSGSFRTRLNNVNEECEAVPPGVCGATIVGIELHVRENEGGNRCWMPAQGCRNGER